MQIDTIALYQGVVNARVKRDINEDFADNLREVIFKIAYQGDAGRMVCDYDKLLVVLSTIEAEWTEMVYLWKYHLGSSLASGITVGHNSGKSRVDQ